MRTMMSMRGLALHALIALAGLALASPALATPVNHGNFSSTNFDFLQVPEDTDQVSDPTDPDELYGAPIVVGDGLLFTPNSNFVAASQDGGPTDNTNSKITMTMMSKSTSNPIDIIAFNESGDTTLSGSSALTQVVAGGVIKILEIDGVVAPTSILLADIAISSTFTPNPISNGALFFSPGDNGLTNWSGLALVDLNAALAGLGYTGPGGVTKATISFDNNLTASTFAAGDSAQIQKKNQLIIEVIPEPGTGLLVGLGLLGLATRRRLSH